MKITLIIIVVISYFMLQVVLFFHLLNNLNKQNSNINPYIRHRYNDGIKDIYKFHKNENIN